MDTQDYIHLLVDHVSKINKDGKVVNTTVSESPESQEFLLEIKDSVENDLNKK
jgi:hypothetical protein